MISVDLIISVGNNRKSQHGKDRKDQTTELQLSSRCLMLSVLYFLSQLCTYTPGIVFYGCGDILLANRRAAMYQLEISRAVFGTETVETLRIYEAEIVEKVHSTPSFLLKDVNVSQGIPASPPLLTNQSYVLHSNNQTGPVRRNANYG